MIARWVERLAIPGFVLLCVLLGGSVQGTWRVMALQLLAVALIAWAAVTPKPEPLTVASRSLLLLGVFAVLLFVIQLIPLPPNVWTKLPERELTDNSYAMLGLTRPWLPVSVAPYETLASSLTLLPPLAVLTGILRLRAFDVNWLAGAVICGALLGVLLGVVQSVRGSGSDAWWYLYDITNPGAVGFFANRNHMGTMLLVSIPFTAALLTSGSKTRKRRNLHPLIAFGPAEFIVVASTVAFLLVLTGIALNLSLAAVLLALPVIGLSAFILPGWRIQRVVFAAVAALAVLALLLFTNNPVLLEITGTDTSSLEARQSIWALSWAAISDTFPVGTGLGSFEQVFPLYESPGDVGATYVNHAHNDYLELVLEGGLPVLLLIAAFLVWWTAQLVRVWKSPLRNPYSRAATIASGVILAHSIVDYPLRTTAIAAIFAACVGLIAQPLSQCRIAADGRLRGARHLKIDRSGHRKIGTFLPSRLPNAGAAIGAKGDAT